MPRKGTIRTRRTRPKGQPEAASASFSIRFTEGNRDLLARAAHLKGRSPTAFIQETALEHAAHVLNTAEKTTFDFLGLAKVLSARLFSTLVEEVRYEDPFGNAGRVCDVPADEDPANYFVNPLSSEILDQLVEAARIGGAEFLAQTIAECNARMNRRDGVRKPIDPQELLKN